MTQAESKLSRKILDALRLEGYFAFKIHGSKYMMAGLPDIIVCANGLFIGLETKVPGKLGNTSESQKRVHTKIRAAEGSVYVVASVSRALEVVQETLVKAGIVQ